uniref:DUF148 domain-containing protein n=1 Tax=Strongyloides papillosus TaxID=174720 RepID=A0A0N5BEG5_STREA
MHFVNYLAIFLLLTVEYSLQESSSSETDTVGVDSLKVGEWNGNLPSVTGEQGEKSVLNHLKQGTKNVNEKIKSFFKTNFSKDGTMKNFKKTEDKIKSVITKSEKAFKRLERKGKDTVKRLLKRKKSYLTAKENNRKKRSLLSKASGFIGKKVGRHMGKLGKSLIGKLD